MTDTNPRKLKIKRQEFYTVYGVSLLLKDAELFDREYLVQFLQPIALKYLLITEHAVRTELRHMRKWCYGLAEAVHECRKDCFYDDSFPREANLRRQRKWAEQRIFNDLGLPAWNYETRRYVSMELAHKLLTVLEWGRDYGGLAWARIARSAIDLRMLLPVTSQSLEKVIAAIDRMNDLAHNNDLYLASHCTFNLHNELDYKRDASALDVIVECPKEIQAIYRDYKNKKVLR